MACYRSILQSAELKKIQCYEISYQEGTVVAFQTSESGLFELFLFQSVEKASFYKLLFSYREFNAKEKPIVLCRNKSLKVILR